MNNLIFKENERIILDLIEKHLSENKYEIKRENDLLQFIFPGKSEETTITIYCDPDEYTVYIGENYHKHFSIYYGDKESEYDQYTEAGENALEFIKDFMSNKIWIEAIYYNGKVVCASAMDEEDSYSTIITPVGRTKDQIKEEKRVFKW